MNQPYWLDSVADFEPPAQSLPAECGLVVLGAGIMGSALAYHLARAGLAPLVLERNPRPAGGATGRNGGLHVGGPSLSYHAARAQLGRAAARDIEALTQRNVHLIEEIAAREALDAGFAVTGGLHLAVDAAEAAELKASAAALREDGFAAEWLERAPAEACLGTALGPGYLGALFRPGDGQIHSARYAFGVAQAAARHGAQFAYGARVAGLAPRRGGWLVTTARGAVWAEQVVVALNAWSSELLPELAELAVPTRGHVLLTAPVSFKVRPWGANRGWEYGRQLDNGQLLVGGKRETRPDLDRGVWPAPEATAPEPLPEVMAALAEFVPAHFPAAAGVPIERHWAGLMAFTPDHQPLVGAWPGRPGLWLLAGFSGHGMSFSQALPQALAAQLSGQPGPAIPAAFAPSRYLQK